jgi:low temperature requirement protein LtrA
LPLTCDDGSLGRVTSRADRSLEENAAPSRDGGPEPSAAEEQRVTSLELFFDLVFVFTLTQLTGLLAGDLSVVSAVRVTLIFVVLFWMYGGYAWLTNQVPPVLPVRRLLLILGMAAFLVCALAIPRAFDDRGVAFGLGYLLVVLVHAGLYASVYGRTMVMWVGPFNVLAAFAVTAAGLLSGPGAYALWVVAILVQFAMPYANRSPARPNIRTAHFVERHGLLLLIALGESVVAIGIGVGHEALTFRLFGAVLLGLALAAALWWSYFAGEEERAEQAFESVTSLNQRLLLAVRAYFFAYVPMLLGIIALAAGVKLSIGEVTHRLDPAPAVTLAAGVALYLAGDVAFRRALRIRPVAYRATAAAMALATAVLGVYVSAAVQLVALVAILLGMLLPEARWRRAALRA